MFRPTLPASAQLTAATIWVQPAFRGRMLSTDASRCIATPTWLPLTTQQNRSLLWIYGKIIRVTWSDFI